LFLLKSKVSEQDTTDRPVVQVQRSFFSTRAQSIDEVARQVAGALPWRCARGGGSSEVSLWAHLRNRVSFQLTSGGRASALLR